MKQLVGFTTTYKITPDKDLFSLSPCVWQRWSDISANTLLTYAGDWSVLKLLRRLQHKQITIDNVSTPTLPNLKYYLDLLKNPKILIIEVKLFCIPNIGGSYHFQLIVNDQVANEYTLKDLVPIMRSFIKNAFVAKHPKWFNI